MASIVLAGVGAAIGGAIGGSVLGISAVQIGATIGGLIGSSIDARLFAPKQEIQGQRLEDLRITSSTEGVVLPRVAGRMRIGGNIIWATDFREERIRSTSNNVTTTEYRYYASFAIGLCEGEISGIGRIWADGDLLDTSSVTMRVYRGTETQVPDAFMEAKMGAGEVPAYRGMAYVMFEDINVTNFGNRIPQMSFEVFRPLTGMDTLEAQLGAIEIRNGTGEFALATTEVLTGTGGTTATENRHSDPAKTDFIVSLDRLEASLPSVKSVTLAVSWFGDDLRANQCNILPMVEASTKALQGGVAWRVGPVTRSVARIVTKDQDGEPAYDGTPSDDTVVQAIDELDRRGFATTFLPLIHMDIREGNTRTDPYSDNGSVIGQPAYPWRGRITSNPAPGFVGTVDKSATAASQVAEFFGTAVAADFSVTSNGTDFGDTVVAYSGDSNDWGYRRYILHYASLFATIGGIDTFLIGSGLRGLTQLRGVGNSFPAVTALRTLAADVSAVLGSGVKVGYSADWTEYSGYQPQDGSGDVYFHLDPLWADANIDFVGIDYTAPLTDWRDGQDHLDAVAGVPSIYDKGYIKSGLEGGEYFDWIYEDAADRDAQVRTPIADWVFRPKDIRSWWSNQHFNRPGGATSGVPTGWVPQSKPVRFTSVGCPAIDRGTNRPEVFIDPKSSESATPWYSRGWRDDAIQRRYLEVLLAYWRDGANNPVSPVYAGPMIDTDHAAARCWDARPFPDWPARKTVWSDWEQWETGHWLTGRAGGAPLAAFAHEICRTGGLEDTELSVDDLWQVISGVAITALESPRSSLTGLAAYFGVDAVESSGVMRFRTRDTVPYATIAPEDMVASNSGDSFELLRGQASELPQALKWTLIRPDDGAYDPAPVEARRANATSVGVESQTFAFAAPLAEAERRCRAALLERWVGIETLTAGLPPSRIALDAGDVIQFNHDGRVVPFRLLTVADAEYRAITAQRHDADIDNLPPSPDRGVTLAPTVSFGTPLARLIDLPQIGDADPDYQPYAAVYAAPWYGSASIWRSPAADGFTLLDSVNTPADFGSLSADLQKGPIWRFDLASELVVTMQSGALYSVTDTELDAGANMLAVEAAAGVWELLQFGQADLIAPGEYRLTRLLRGQRGTEAAMGDPAPAGAQVVLVDGLVPVGIAQADVARAFNWRIGPASVDAADSVNAALSFTPAGRGLRPFSPAQLRGRQDISSGDISLSWQRRDRAVSAGSWELLQTPLSESAPSYNLEILNAAGSTVLRTVPGLSAESWTYSASDQITDFGGTIDAVRLRVFQVGALGRGTPLETFARMTRT